MASVHTAIKPPLVIQKFDEIVHFFVFPELVGIGANVLDGEGEKKQVGNSVLEDFNWLSFECLVNAMKHKPRFTLAYFKFHFIQIFYLSNTVFDTFDQEIKKYCVFKFFKPRVKEIKDLWVL